MSALAEVPIRVKSEVELETAFRTHRNGVFQAAYRVTGNAADAEDVLQTVFLRFARREDDAAEVSNLKSYLYRAAVNAALDLLRTRQTARLEPLDEAYLASSVQKHDDLGLRRWLRSALLKLNPRHAEMFSLRSASSVSDLPGCPVAGCTIRSSASRMFFCPSTLLRVLVRA